MTEMSQNDLLRLTATITGQASAFSGLGQYILQLKNTVKLAAIVIGGSFLGGSVIVAAAIWFR